MRMPSFNKQKALCISCKVNSVPLDKPLRPCKSCRQKKETVNTSSLRIGQKQPAAIIETENGVKVFVDKTGKEVPNPGYDLNSDPRGFKHTGTFPKKRQMV